MVKAGKIEQFALNCQHTEDVIPLPVGDLAPEAITFKLGEDGVFGTARPRGWCLEIGYAWAMPER